MLAWLALFAAGCLCFLDGYCHGQKRGWRHGFEAGWSECTAAIPETIEAVIDERLERMTRKDYEKFARMLRTYTKRAANHKDQDSLEAAQYWDTVSFAVGVCVDVFAEDDPHFDRKRFLEACGL